MKNQHANIDEFQLFLNFILLRFILYIDSLYPLQYLELSKRDGVVFFDFFMKMQPIRILVIYLIVLAVIGSISWTWGKPIDFLFQIRNYAFIYAAMFSVGWGMCKVMKKPMPRWEDRVITSLILFLLFDSFLQWWAFPLVGGITEVAQRLIRVPTGPVFNPAALGALVVSFFYLLPSWWGASFSPRIPITTDGLSVAALITFPVAGFITWKYKKYWIAGVGALVACIAYLVLFQLSPVFLFLEGTLAFYLLVMAVEPKTTPILRNEQIGFGIMLGIMMPILLKVGFLEPYAGALVAANGLFQLYGYLNRKTGGFGLKKKPTVVTSQPIQPTQSTQLVVSPQPQQ